jgi:hypothetical protein
MGTQQDTGNSHAPLGLRDYLDAAISASNRSRNIIVIFVITSVIVGIGTLNALALGWAADRLKASKTIDSIYVHEKIGVPPPKNTPEYQAYDEHYKQLYGAFVTSYVESALAVRAPLFGVAIDVNDLGAVGGFALLIELLMFGIAVRRECKNLNIGFIRAQSEDALPVFYDILAMAQVLTIPAHEPADQRHGARSVVGLICFLPLVAQATLVAHDIYTDSTGVLLDNLHDKILLFVELGWLFLIVGLTVRIWRQVHDTEAIWNEWAKIRFLKPTETESSNLT